MSNFFRNRNSLKSIPSLIIKASAGGELVFGDLLSVYDGGYIYYRLSTDGKYVLIGLWGDNVSPTAGNRYLIGTRVNTTNYATAERIASLLGKTLVREITSEIFGYQVDVRYWSGSSWVGTSSGTKVLYMIEVS